MSDDDVLDLTAAERTLRKLAQDAREQTAAGRRPDDLFECYRLVIDELDELRARLHDLEGEGPQPDENSRQAMRDVRRRGKVYGALSDQKIIGTIFSWRWLDAPELERIAALAVHALREEDDRRGNAAVMLLDEVLAVLGTDPVPDEHAKVHPGISVWTLDHWRSAVAKLRDGQAPTGEALLAAPHDTDVAAATAGPRKPRPGVANLDPPPFAPELADAPLVTGESGALGPMVVDQPLHDSTLPAELGQRSHIATAQCRGCGSWLAAEVEPNGPLLMCPSCGTHSRPTS